MAGYRGYRARGGGRSYATRSTRKRSGSAGRNSRGRAAKRGLSNQVVRLVIEQAPPSGVSRYPALAKRIDPPARKAKF